MYSSKEEEETLAFIQREVRLAFSTQISASEARDFAIDYLCSIPPSIRANSELACEWSWVVEEECIRRETPRERRRRWHIMAENDLARMKS